MLRFLTIFLCLLITILIVVLLLLPRYEEIKSYQPEVEQKKTEIEYQEEKIVHLNNLSQKLNQYQLEIQKINLALPQNLSLSLPSLFNFLQEKASENGLVLQDISPFSITLFNEEKETALSGINQIFFEFKVLGSYQAFKNFLSVLEKSARIIEIEKTSFFIRIEEETPPSYELTIKTYSY